MEIYILILLVVTVIGLLIGLVMISQKLRELKSSSAVELMKSDVTELSRNIQGLQQSLGEKVETGNHAMQTNMQKQTLKAVNKSSCHQILS